MKAFIALCVLVIGAYCAPTIDEFNNEWTLFKRVHEKQYSSVQEEATRYIIQYFHFYQSRPFIF